MGGSLRLTKYEDDDEEFPDYDDSFVFCYRYSGLHWMKGEVLRGVIAYIKHLQTAKKDNVEGARQFYIDAGIKTINTDQTDEEAVERATPILASALRTANKWVRSPRNPPGVDGILAGRGGLFSGVGGFGGMGLPSLDDMCDFNYRLQEILDLSNCPIELDKAGLRGLYELMRMADNNQMIYPDQAQMMAQVLDKTLPFLKKDGNEEDPTEMVTELSDLLKKCTEDTMTIRG
ncbi:hypothetical protein VNI00_011901 [Paramarasmius palmivorus]|uniref:Uncharacterized protein n=1 Tax=Paramarasmius palmivorus TaxID=297713 RepID=A0AAW0C7I0_9AGAR